MPRVLVLAYYFPPLGGSGVQRVAKLVKYLPRFGWQPEVLTPQPRRYHAHDDSLQREVEAAGIPVHRTSSVDPTRLGSGVVGQNALSDGRQRLAGLMTGTLFMPDNKIGWLPFALRKARALLRTGSFDAILSSAPPYTSHVIAARLGREFGLPVVLDYRDDWLGNPRHVYPTMWHRNRHARLERSVTRQASALVTINDTIASALRARTEAHIPIHVHPHGFDPADFSGPPAPRSAHRMRLVYTGLFYDKQRPDPFLHGLSHFIGAHPTAAQQVEAIFAGRVPPYFDPLVERLGLSDVVAYAGYLPHPESVALLCSADVLWMTFGEAPGADQISTSKLFEYIGTRHPILGIVPEGEAARALRAYGCATVVPPTDVGAISGALAAYWETWQKGVRCHPDEEYLQRHDRIHLAGQMADVLSHALATHHAD